MQYNPFVDLETVDADYLRNTYLPNIVIKGADGQPLPDAFFEEHLQTAMGSLEERTNVDILQRVNVAEKHDYHANDYLSYGWLQLFRIPCQRVEEVRVVFPAGNSQQVFPSEWVRLEVSHSMLQLVPTGGTLMQTTVGQGGWYPFMWASSYLPQMWEVDYVSGFDPRKVPRIIVEALCKLAILEILAPLSNLVHPIGVASQSLSVDGLSQSRGFMQPAFKAMIDQYRMDLYGEFDKPGLIDQIRNSFLGILVTGA